MASLLVLWLLSHTLLLQTTAAPVTNQTCSNYVLISTRGTDEPQGPSRSFPGMINDTLAAVPGGTTYNTVYPAGSDTQGVGAADIIRYIDAGLAACPDQKYALLGYSQGATATAIALQNYNATSSAAYAAIRGALVVGNPAHEAFHKANTDQVGGNSTNGDYGILYITTTHVPKLWYENTKFLDICYIDDIVCNGLTLGALLNAGANHVKYGPSASVQTLGANFLISHLS